MAQITRSAKKDPLAQLSGLMSMGQSAKGLMGGSESVAGAGGVNGAAGATSVGAAGTAGAGATGASGGAAGAAGGAGSSAGSAVPVAGAVLMGAQAAKGMMDAKKGNGEQAIPAPSNPLARRLESLQGDPVIKLNEGIMALAQAPEEVRRAYAQPLTQAYFQAKRGLT